MPIYRKTCLLAFTAVCCALFAAPTFAQGGYAVTSKIAIPGTGGWDYLNVDEAARRLYVSHGTQVEVVTSTQRALRLRFQIRPEFMALRWRRNWGAGLLPMGRLRPSRFLI